MKQKIPPEEDTATATQQGDSQQVAQAETQAKTVSTMQTTQEAPPPPKQSPPEAVPPTETATQKQDAQPKQSKQSKPEAPLKQPHPEAVPPTETATQKQDTQPEQSKPEQSKPEQSKPEAPPTQDAPSPKSEANAVTSLQQKIVGYARGNLERQFGQSDFLSKLPLTVNNSGEVFFGETSLEELSTLLQSFVASATKLAQPSQSTPPQPTTVAPQEPPQPPKPSVDPSKLVVNQPPPETQSDNERIKKFMDAILILATQK